MREGGVLAETRLSVTVTAVRMLFGSSIARPYVLAITLEYLRITGLQM